MCICLPASLCPAGLDLLEPLASASGGSTMLYSSLERALLPQARSRSTIACPCGHCLVTVLSSLCPLSPASLHTPSLRSLSLDSSPLRRMCTKRCSSPGPLPACCACAARPSSRWWGTTGACWQTGTLRRAALLSTAHDLPACLPGCADVPTGGVFLLPCACTPPRLTKPTVAALCAASTATCTTWCPAAQTTPLRSTSTGRRPAPPAPRPPCSSCCSTACCIRSRPRPGRRAGECVCPCVCCERVRGDGRCIHLVRCVLTPDQAG